MEENETELLLAKLDGSGSDVEWGAVERLRAMAGNLPMLLRRKFQTAKGWKIRMSCVYHSIRYARTNDDAFHLGLEAILDRAKYVRYRGAMLLAYAQRADALPALRAATTAQNDSDGDLSAAIDAIEARNHNYFVDRNHTGKNNAYN
ncbi:MAG: hypothetical protein IPK82_35220 [Polyangiaceae bacterium]|nr:hypothetical protein [Polyangiaceae bacterium]